MPASAGARGVETKQSRRKSIWAIGSLRFGDLFFYGPETKRPQQKGERTRNSLGGFPIFSRNGAPARRPAGQFWRYVGVGHSALAQAIDHLVANNSVQRTFPLLGRAILVDRKAFKSREKTPK